jgi:translocation and assembly module TamB
MHGDPHQERSVRKRLLRLRRVVRRRWLFGILPFLVLAIALVAMAPTIVANTGLLHKILSAALVDFDGRITVGSASLGWFSPVVARDIVAVDAAGTPLAQVPALRSQRSLLGLIFHQRDPGGFQVETPAIFLNLRPEGSNWEDALSNYLDQPGGESTVDRLQVKVVGATVQIQDSNAGEWQMEDLDLEFMMSHREGPWLEMRVETDVRSAGASPGRITAELVCQTPVAPDQTLGAGQLVWQVAELPLSPMNAMLHRAGLDVELAGIASARGEFRWEDGLADPQWRLSELNAQQFALRSPTWLGEDSVTSNSLDMRGLVSQMGGQWRMENVALECDFARLEARGALPQGSEQGFDWLDLIRDLQKEQVRISGRLDVAALATMMPRMLRIRPTTQITSGNVTFSLASQTGGEPSFSANLQAADLAAIEDGRPVAWKEPILASADFRYTADGPVIDQLVCHAEFMDVVASGRWNSGSATVQGDLNRMVTEVGRLVDLGEFRMAGRIDGRLQWEQSMAERWQANGRIELHEFELAMADLLPWKEDHLIVDLAGQARLDQGDVTEIPAASFDLRSANDRLTVRLTESVRLPWPQVAWPLQLQANGLLETWLPRLQPLVSLQGWQAAGTIDLTAKATVDPQRVAAEPIRLVVRDLRAQNRDLGVFLDEPTVRLETTGFWDLDSNLLNAAETTLTSSTVALRAQEVQIQIPGDRTSVRGSIGYRGDLNRLAGWFQVPDQPSTSRLNGSATGTVQATHDDRSTQLDWTMDVVDFAYATRVPPVAGVPVRPVSLPQSWQEIWREASIRFAGRQRYDSADDRLHIDRLSVAASELQLEVQGQIDRLMDQAEADLKGTLDYDLADVTRNLQASLGESIRLTGRQQGRFQIAGPLRLASSTDGSAAHVIHSSRTQGATAAAAALVPAAWRGSARAGWQSVDLHGLQLGPADLQGTLRHSVLQLDPLDVSLSQGRILAEPRLDLSSLPARLMLDQGPLLENVHISPELCETWLKYVAPILSDATRAEGTFSLTLDNATVPVPDSTQTTARGVLTVHGGRVGPGPLAQEFLGAAQQVRAIIDSGQSNPGNQATTWLVLPDQQVPFDVQRGRVHHRGLTVMAGDLVIRTSGSVGFDQTLALLAEVPIQDRWIANRRLLQGLKGTTLQLPIQGSFSQPKTDRRALADLNQQMMRDAASGALEQGIGRGLQQLFGPRPE